MKKAIIYCRTAASEQTSGLNIDFQKEQCLSYARNRNFKIADSITEVESGVELMRKGILQIFFGCCENGVEAVIAYDASRISRDFSQFRSIKQCLEKLGVRLLLVNDFEKDMTEEFSKLFKRYEERIRVERIEQGIAQAKAGKQLNSIK